MKKKIKNWIRNFIYSRIAPPSMPLSYSQAGEDAIIRFLFRDIKISNIQYLDLGTNVPDDGNNTYLFYTHGCRGVCVEADISLIPEIKSKRPQDIIINAGVSTSDESEADFYVFNIPAINTFDKKEAELRNSFPNAKLVKVVKVPLIGINKLIENNFDKYPHLLSIDIEGMDLDVLKSLDFKAYPVPVICVETCVYSETHIRPKDLRIASFMASIGYEVYADTYINTIFINKQWFYNKA